MRHDHILKRAFLCCWNGFSDTESKVDLNQNLSKNNAKSIYVSDLCQHFPLILNSCNAGFKQLLWIPKGWYSRYWLRRMAEVRLKRKCYLRGQWSPFSAEWSASVIFPYRPRLFDQEQTDAYSWDTDPCQQRLVTCPYRQSRIEINNHFPIWAAAKRDLRLYSLNRGNTNHVTLSLFPVLSISKWKDSVDKWREKQYKK